ncbi:hypothetical protein SAMN05660649_04979 [Desulfotomaculum arcticum]|uniref:Uncharacterized protein n=1 Tax=Desulfotruncus arcticus DSM 17038 TaxID=1121424 RepID=A0A1I2ZJT5_9FIRM|nr:hypothetical protein [Desulfotruncus arcticus]SFH38068.1 hypothetical protein SAMN05660649_04979 [Desulfotomaculum arcticum] [Desulfotruncus arcticus DSM 17038]
MKDVKLPVALFNGTVATTNGLYSIKDIDIASAKRTKPEIRDEASSEKTV